MRHLPILPNYPGLAFERPKIDPTRSIPTLPTRQVTYYCTQKEIGSLL